MCDLPFVWRYDKNIPLLIKTTKTYRKNMCNFFDCLLYILKTFHFSLGCSLNLNLEPFNNFVEKYGGRGGQNVCFVPLRV